MFAREAAAYARLSHASVVRLFDFFSHGDQLFVMVLEFMEPPPANRLRATLKDMGKTLPDTAALYVASHVFEALASAHDYIDPSGKAAPVIHRDVNPSNVLVGWNGDVRLAISASRPRRGGCTRTPRTASSRAPSATWRPSRWLVARHWHPHRRVHRPSVLLWEMLAQPEGDPEGGPAQMRILRARHGGSRTSCPSLDVLRPNLPRARARGRGAHSRARPPEADDHRGGGLVHFCKRDRAPRRPAPSSSRWRSSSTSERP